MYRLQPCLAQILESGSKNLLALNIFQISIQHNETELDRQIPDAYPTAYPWAKHQKGLVHLDRWFVWTGRLE